MLEYYLDMHRDNDGYYKMHRSKCKYLPKTKNMLYLGRYSNANAAMAISNKYFTLTVSECDFCKK